mgnify:FL=1
MTEPAPDRTNPVIVYTDGACDPNPGYGGWSAILIYNGHMKELSGGEAHSTNNRMEMTAAIKALEALKRPCAVIVNTDSEYLKRGVTEWMPKWRRFNWRRKGGQLKNVELWQRLDELTRLHDVQWQWVRGHAGNPLNERCDQLANMEVWNQKARGKQSGGGA